MCNTSSNNNTDKTINADPDLYCNVYTTHLVVEGKRAVPGRLLSYTHRTIGSSLTHH